MENTPNRFEELDKMEQNKQEQQVISKPKKPKKKASTAASIICVICGLVFGFLITSGKLFPPKKKTFESHGITVTLTEDFYEKDFLGFQVAYLSDKSIFAANREDKYMFDNMGIDDLDDYIEAVIGLNGKQSKISKSKAENGEEFYYAEYSSTVDGDDFSYLLVAFEGDDHYYAINFGCKSKNYDSLKDQYMKWTKTISVK
jgi:hypothetical protein